MTNRYFDVEEARAVIREQLREQGLPEKVEDPDALRAIARLLTSGPPVQGATRSIGESGQSSKSGSARPS